LRPQLLDRFGLAVEVRTPQELPVRIEVLRRRDLYERDPEAFCAQWDRDDAKLRRQILKGRAALAEVQTGDALLEAASKLCMALGTDGLRGELTLIRAARALASLEGCTAVTVAHLRRVAPSALRHRLRRNPLDESGSTARVERAMAEVLGP
jgi:magnesium chelatase subunit I